MLSLLAVAAIQALSLPLAEPVNPRATDLFDRDPVLAAWAVRRFDLNKDGWLTTFEAQPALLEFKDLADSNRDGRVSVREYERAKAFIRTRDNLSAAGEPFTPG